MAQVGRGDARALQLGPHRPGGAALLDRITVDYYGTPSPLKNIATINVPEPRMLDDPAVRPLGAEADRAGDPWSPTSACTPSNDGKIIRLPIPQLTEERRKEYVKVVRNMAEEGRVAVRNVRRDVMRHLEELVQKRRGRRRRGARARKARVQKLTDEHVHQIDELLKRKEAEIMEV